MKKSKGRLIKIFSAAAAVAGALFAGLAANSYGLVRTDYTIYSEKVSRTYTIAHLSDLHDTLFGKGQSQLLELIKEADPDIVVLTGDIYDDKEKNLNTDLLIKGLEGYNCFFVSGNHEIYDFKGYPAHVEFMKSCGIRVLENETLYLNDEIALTGFADNIDDYGGQRTETHNILSHVTAFTATEDYAALKNDSRFHLMLIHYPNFFDLYTEQGVFDLVLCGHTHGGQWRIPGRKEGLFGPGATLFPEYSGGFYEKNGTAMIVSKGLSRHEIIPRIFNNPELAVIRISPKGTDSK